MQERDEENSLGQKEDDEDEADEIEDEEETGAFPTQKPWGSTKLNWRPNKINMQHRHGLGENKQKCVVCERRTKYMCVDCNQIPVCDSVYKRSKKEKNCIELFHGDRMRYLKMRKMM